MMCCCMSILLLPSIRTECRREHSCAGRFGLNLNFVIYYRRAVRTSRRSLVSVMLLLWNLIERLYLRVGGLIIGWKVVYRHYELVK